MARIEEKDYEVQELEVTRYECDWCGGVVDEPDINHQSVSEGPDGGGEPLDTGHICDSCVEKGRRLSLVDMMERRQRVSLALKGGQMLVAGGFLSPVGAALMYGAYVLTEPLGVLGLAAGLVAGLVYALVVAAVLGKHFVTVEGSA
jgi:hypothetical protein